VALIIGSIDLGYASSLLRAIICPIAPNVVIPEDLEPSADHIQKALML
jgi:hypothetical protein